MLWILLISAVLYLFILGLLSLRVWGIRDFIDLPFADGSTFPDGQSPVFDPLIADSQSLGVISGAPPLSVIIAARNEAVHLEQHLITVLEQSYPSDFEVVLVLDRCTDQSVEITATLAEQYDHLKVIEISATAEGWAPKKWALTQGIKAANHEHLVFTDADCMPAEGWLNQMGRRLGEGHELVLGLGPYHRSQGLLNALIRYETWYTALQYIAWAAMGRPYMAVGRNLAYTKSFFKEAGGFEVHRHRLSGDDDLLVNAASNGTAPGIVLHSSGHVFSKPKTTFRGWINQKLRHLSAGSSYRSGSLFILSIFHGLHAIFYISLTLVLCSTPWTLEVLEIYLARTIIAWVLLILPANKWGIDASLIWFPLLDILYFYYNLLLVPASLFHKPKWKGN